MCKSMFAMLLAVMLVACGSTVTPTAGVTATHTPMPSVPRQTPEPSEPTDTATLAPTAAPAATATATLPPATATATPTSAPSATPSGPLQVRVEEVARGLQIPWALAFAPDGRILLTERPGRIRIIQDGQLLPEPAAVLPVAAEGEGGLLGLALDPQFADNGYLYVMYTYRQGGALHNRISRLTLVGNEASSELVLLDNLPAALNHDGGRLAFGPDGKLYATVGDATLRDLAQQPDQLAGVILRMNADGSVPDDNPLPGSLVYSYGHRNPEGLAWQPGTDILWSTEHGPSGENGLCCRDELNRIVPGGNYGWPIVTLDSTDSRFIPPVLTSGPTDTWAPAALAFYDAEPLAAWRGNAFFGALRGQHLQRVVLGGSDQAQVTVTERLFEGVYGRIREVAVGPDGYIYFTTSNRDGRGSPAPEDDRVLRIVPEQ